jgi:hypothetical protein
VRQAELSKLQKLIHLLGSGTLGLQHSALSTTVLRAPIYCTKESLIKSNALHKSSTLQMVLLSCSMNVHHSIYLSYSSLHSLQWSLTYCSHNICSSVACTHPTIITMYSPLFQKRKQVNFSCGDLTINSILISSYSPREIITSSVIFST